MGKEKLPIHLIFLSVTLIVVFLLTGMKAPASEEKQSTLRVFPVRVYDGDTIYVDIPGQLPLFGESMSVRILGIDTPEIRGKCEWEKALALQAKKLVEDLVLKAKHVYLIDPQRGKYFRVLARVEADGVDLSDALILTKLARPYDGGARQGWCDEEETK